MERVIARSNQAPATGCAVEANRCDRCGGRAWVQVVLSTGGDLVFCRRHALEHERALEQAAVWIGELAS